MFASLRWNVVSSVVTIGVAVVVAQKAHTDFEILAFVMALIAYHRILWLIEGGFQDLRERGFALAALLYRLDYKVRNVEPKDPDLRKLLDEVIPENRERSFVQAQEMINKHSDKHRVAFEIHVATELVLVAGVIYVLVR